jgi:hypothetical protein
VCEVSLGFRLEPTTSLFTPHSGEPLALSSGEFVPVRIFPATDLGRKPSIMTCRSQWSTRPLSLVLIVSSPFRTVVDSLFVNNESTAFTVVSFIPRHSQQIVEIPHQYLQTDLGVMRLFHRAVYI